MKTDNLAEFEKAFNKVSKKLDRINETISSVNDHFNFGGNIKKVWHNAFFYWISHEIPFDELAAMTDLEIIPYMKQFAVKQQKVFDGKMKKIEPPVFDGTPGKFAREILKEAHLNNNGRLTGKQIEDLVNGDKKKAKYMKNLYAEMEDLKE
jgi:hypothetical protein